MQYGKTQISDVIYNAAEERFEACVTFHRLGGTVKVPARFDAPISTEFRTASKGLLRQAEKTLHGSGMRSRCPSPRPLRESARSVLSRSTPRWAGAWWRRILDPAAA